MLQILRTVWADMHITPEEETERDLKRARELIWCDDTPSQKARSVPLPWDSL